MPYESSTSRRLWIFVVPSPLLSLWQFSGLRDLTPAPSGSESDMPCGERGTACPCLVPSWIRGTGTAFPTVFCCEHCSPVCSHSTCTYVYDMGREEERRKERGIFERKGGRKEGEGNIWEEGRRGGRRGEYLRGERRKGEKREVRERRD